MSLQKYILKENIKDNIYHFTDLNKIYGILKNNTINLSLNLGTHSDQKSGTDKYYFLSMQRTKSGKLGYSRNKDIRVELDRRVLSYKDSIKPVDYWGHEFVQINPTMADEMEDRLISTKPDISPASDIILSIDIFMNPHQKNTQLYLDIQELCSKYDIEVYFFDDENAFRNANRNLAIVDIANTIDEPTRVKMRGLSAFPQDYQTLLAFLIVMNPSMRSKHIDNLVELYRRRIYKSVEDFEDHKDDDPELYQALLKKREESDSTNFKSEIEKKLDKEVRSMEDRITYAHGANLVDTSSYISSYVHNNKSSEDKKMRELLHDIVKEFRSKKVHNINSMIIKLRDNKTP